MAKQDKISLEKLRKLIRALNVNPHCAYTEILYFTKTLYFHSCENCPYHALPCWCLLGTEKYILK